MTSEGNGDIVKLAKISKFQFRFKCKPAKIINSMQIFTFKNNSMLLIMLINVLSGFDFVPVTFAQLVQNLKYYVNEY